MASATLLSTSLSAQAPSDTVRVADSARAASGSQVLIPVASVILPGLGQYIHRAPAAGVAYTAVGIGGIVLSSLADEYEGDFPRRGREQLAEAAGDAAMLASFLGGWDAFHRAVPAMRAQGKYDFLPTRRESIGSLVSAPFDAKLLRRWTTWVDLAQTAAITALILSERESGTAYTPFRSGDAAYVGVASMSAAVGEEAMFRGYLLPMLHQTTGRRFWVANGIQASVFGAAHLPDAGPAALYIAAWSAWEGWITKRNDWSLRESVFHHFWYDVAIFTAAMLVEKQNAPAARLTFPPVRI